MGLYTRNVLFCIEDLFAQPVMLMLSL